MTILNATVFNFSKAVKRFGKTAQRSRELAALTEDPGVVLSTTWWFITICDSIFRGQGLSSDLRWHHAHKWCAYKHAGTNNTHLKNIKINLKNMFKLVKIPGQVVRSVSPIIGGRDRRIPNLGSVWGTE